MNGAGSVLMTTHRVLDDTLHNAHPPPFTAGSGPCACEGGKKPTVGFFSPPSSSWRMGGEQRTLWETLREGETQERA